MIILLMVIFIIVFKHYLPFFQIWFGALKFQFMQTFCAWILQIVEFIVFYLESRTLTSISWRDHLITQPGHFIVPPQCYRSAPPCRTPFLWAFLMSQISREIPNLSLASDHCWGCLLLGETPWTQIYLIHQQPSQGWRYKLNCLLLWLAINNQPTLRNFGYPVPTKLYCTLKQLQR